MAETVEKAITYVFAGRLIRNAETPQATEIGHNDCRPVHVRGSSFTVNDRVVGRYIHGHVWRLSIF